MRSIAILLLAAGTSRRLGQPKQLLTVGHVSLLQKSMQHCIAASDQVVVVLGAHQAEIESQVDFSDVQRIQNEQWAEGMGKSIAVGMQYLINLDIDGVIICVADQPYLSTALFEKLREKIHPLDTAQIILSKYNTGQGPPTYFSKHFFDDLLSLNDDDGAKKIIKANPKLIEYISFPLGHKDIDTIDDYNHYLEQNR